MQSRAQLPGADGCAEAAAAAWRERLADAPLLLQLPADLPPPDAPSGRTAGVTLTLSGPEAAAARALAEGEGSSLLDALLAGWQALLRRYARAEAVVTGAALSGCGGSAGAQRMDGADTQLVPILTDLTGAAARARTHAASLAHCPDLSGWSCDPRHAQLLLAQAFSTGAAFSSLSETQALCDACSHVSDELLGMQAACRSGS